MENPRQPWRVPVIAVICGLVFAIYGLLVPSPYTVACEVTAAGVVCEASQAQLGGRGWVSHQRFQLVDIRVASELCDNIPRGGVRFCHCLTLVGDRGEYPLPNIRSPLSAATLMADLHRFMAGEGSTRLVWSGDRPLGLWVRLGAVGLLLAIAAWGLWDIQWPPLPGEPLGIVLDQADGDREQ